MAGFEVRSNEHLIREQLWSKQLKTLTEEEMCAQRYVRILSDFPDGNLINIPSMGNAEVSDFVEGGAIKYSRFDTGNFQFELDQYKFSANSISEQFKQDSFYTSEVIAQFLPRQHRALMESFEARTLSRGNAAQTATDLNVINGASHRWVGGGTGQRITLNDFAKARYALRKALMPMTNLVAIVDPTVTHTIMTQTNIMNILTPDPKWQRVVNEGLVTGMTFRFNIFGFDVYESDFLPRIADETIDSVQVQGGVANQFFSAAGGDILPYVGAWRQMPTVYSEFNKDLQQWEYMTIMRYGVEVFRPENMVNVLTALDVVD